MEAEHEPDDEIRAQRRHRASASLHASSPKDKMREKKLGDFAKIFDFIVTAKEIPIHSSPTPSSPATTSSATSSESTCSGKSSATTLTSPPSVIRPSRALSLTPPGSITPRNSSQVTATTSSPFKEVLYSLEGWPIQASPNSSSDGTIESRAQRKTTAIEAFTAAQHHISMHHNYNITSGSSAIHAEEVKFNNLVHLLHREMEKDLSLRFKYPGRAGQVHLFVDMSNIYIGFSNTMKDLRGFSKHDRSYKAALCFRTLSHILERGRKVGVRELVGSAADPEDIFSLPQYFHHAQELGYQTSVLRRVLKPARVNRKGSPRESSSSSSEYYGVSTRNMAYREQGVDEILQLKMANAAMALVGYPGVMVLATGDAEKAEYSDGFQATAERILNMGWMVELVSWKKSLSSAWKAPDWTQRWGDRFRIIELDAYVEEVEAMSS